MKILIVGGGIGGLAAAGFLERKGFDVTLIEQAPAFKHIGFSMSIFSNGRRMLQELGIDDEVSKEGYPVPWIELNDVKGHVLGHKINLKDLQHLGEEPMIAIERADLHGALVRNLKNTKILLGTTIKKIKSEQEKVLAEFSDNTYHTFDLLVASDGIHSKTREEFFSKGESKPYGWNLRLLWAPKHIPAPKGMVFISKKGYLMGLYPLKGKFCVALGQYDPRKKNPPVVIADFLPYLRKHGWYEQDIKDLEKELADIHEYHDQIHYIELGAWYKKRVVLLGDSRHALSPFSGMGASMALEDAFVLADELAKVKSTHVDFALKNYENRRNGRVKEVSEYSNFILKLYFVKNFLSEKIRTWTLKLFSGLVFKRWVRKLEVILDRPI